MNKNNLTIFLEIPINNKFRFKKTQHFLKIKIQFKTPMNNKYKK